MKDLGKQNLLGVLIDAVDYQAAVDKIITAAKDGAGMTVAALPVHGVMSGVVNQELRYVLNHLDLVVPDGQPVRWALNWLHHTGLTDRVYGPTLMLEICRRAAGESLPIYLYGSRQETIDLLSRNLRSRFPELIVSGSQPGRYRLLSIQEKTRAIKEIRDSGAAILFSGLGCPKQERWIFEHKPSLAMPLIAVGAAFDFHAGLKPQAPALLQDWGLEWLFRLMHEPRRLWKRYLLYNPLYLMLLSLQASGLAKYDPDVSRHQVSFLFCTRCLMLAFVFDSIIMVISE